MKGKLFLTIFVWEGKVAAAFFTCLVNSQSLSTKKNKWVLVLNVFIISCFELMYRRALFKVAFYLGTIVILMLMMLMHLVIWKALWQALNAHNCIYSFPWIGSFMIPIYLRVNWVFNMFSNLLKVTQLVRIERQYPVCSDLKSHYGTLLACKSLLFFMN